MTPGHEPPVGAEALGEVAAMFPLGTVLFPGVGLPLRIFEPRYRIMTRHCLDTGAGFGVVLIAAGSEVGGGDDRFEVATMAEIVHADVADDGQASIVAVGVQRVRVQMWLPDDPYPRASVTPMVDPDTPHPSDVAGIVRRVRRMLAQRTELNLPAPPATIELADDPTAALWQVCALLPVAPHDDLAMLATPTAAARIGLIARLLDGVEADLVERLASPGHRPDDGMGPDPETGPIDPLDG